MARSRRKTPKLAFSSSSSEKDDKQRAARKGRRHAKIKLAVSGEPDRPPEHKRSGTWTFAKDGKRWVKKPRASAMRK
jgi:hypothetical protein